jgi:hypothetical protein
MHFHGKKKENIHPLIVRYLPAPRLRQAGLTMNGKQNNRSVTSPVRPEVSKGERDSL